MGELDHAIYMRLPKGVSINGQMFCKLNRSLYGLKQAGITFRKLLHTEMMSIPGMVCNDFDSCFYAFFQHGVIFFCLVHVDNMIIAHNSQGFHDRLFARMNAWAARHDSEVTHEGDLRKTLGVYFAWHNNRTVLKMNQNEFI